MNKTVTASDLRYAADLFIPLCKTQSKHSVGDIRSCYCLFFNFIARYYPFSYWLKPAAHDACFPAEWLQASCAAGFINAE